MMKTKIFYTAICILALSSCTKETARLSPGTLEITPFDVTTDAMEVKHGDPVNFKFQGNADTIYFWSGEFGKDYNYRDGREVEIENPTLRIRTASSYGHQESLRILLSQDFDGDYSYEGITAATWKDMTPRFGIPKPIPGSELGEASNYAVHYSSPMIDISEFIEGDQTYYIGVRNQIVQSSAGNLPTQWYFYGVSSASSPGWSYTGSLANGTTVEIAGFLEAEWKFANKDYTGPRVTMPFLSPETGTPTSLFFGRNSPSANAMDTWAVSKAFATTMEIAGDSQRTLIKRISDLPREEYGYTFAEPGEYDVTFQTINQDRTTQVVQVKVVVVPND